MSLRVWLPLNGNLENKGISDIEMIGAPASWDTNGKIGKCATFTGSTNNVIYNNTTDYNYTDNFSWAIWIKTNFTGTATQFIFTNGRADAGGHGYGLRCTSATVCNCYFGSRTIPVSVTGGEWTHLAFTKSGTDIKIYKNGILEFKETFSGTLPTYSDGNGLGLGCFHYASNIYPYYGSINDFRIYDHCLSQKEVKEIGQGLILHYKLNGWSGGVGENLVWNSDWGKSFSSPPDNWRDWGSPTTREIVTINNKKWLHLVSTSTAFQGWQQNWTNRNGFGDILPNIQYTVSFTAFIKTAASFAPIGIHWNDSSGTILAQSWPNINLTTTPTRYNYTATTPANCSSFNIMVGDNSNAAHEVWITDIKLELGNIATPWSLSFSEMGIDTTKIPDSSGYGNDGIVEGNISLSTDSPRYGMSTYFNNDAQRNCGIFVNNFTMPFEQYTISIWIKDSVKHKMSLGNNSSLSNGSNQFYLYGDNSWKYVHGGTSGEYYFSHNNSATIGDWIHYGIVYDGSKVQIYRNGTDEGSKDTTGLAIFNNISLGVGYSGQNYQAPSYISDFRIYATALSAEDVATLYHTSAQVDDLGSFHGFELKEESGNQFATEEIIKNSATSVEWDSENKRYIITSPVGTSSWGYGFKIKGDVEDNRKIIPWGKTSIFTFEVYSPIATIGATDYNNYAIDNSQTGGNDNDGARGTANFDIPANTWTLCTLSLTNNNSTKNPNQVALYDCSTFGLRTNGMSEPLVWYVRNPQWYLVETEKFQVEQNGVFITNFIKEDDLKDYASFRDNEKAAWANNFIEK